MFLPLLLIFFATLSAAIAVYGTLPQWVLYEHGMQVIEITRRLQWPLFTLSLLLILILITLIIIGRQRAWWLVGLGPLLALFVHQFLIGSINAYKVLENPPCVAAAESTIKPNEFVVGVRYGESYYAYPYRYLYYAPVIVQSERDRRYVLLWSAFANRVLAWQAKVTLHARDLDIVSMPANSLLVYNSRVGEFVSAVTGLTPEGQKPRGFVAPVQAWKMTWAQWLAQHPKTRVMELPALSSRVTMPVLPQFPVPAATRPASRPATSPALMAEVEPEPQVDPLTLILLIPSTQPAAIVQSKITGDPLNFEHDGVPLMAFRDPATGLPRVYDRRYQGTDSRFVRNFSPTRAKKHKVALLDVATNSGWTIDGLAVDADMPVKDSRLRPIPNIEEGLYWGVMKYWYPDLKLIGEAK